MARKRYLVEYVHLDGNRYLLMETNSPQVAQAIADNERVKNKTIRMLKLPVLITDLQNEEMGNMDGRLLEE